LHQAHALRPGTQEEGLEFDAPEDSANHLLNAEH
jgi:hypothetical protein